MLLLLPPSEGKTTPVAGPPVDLTALSHAAALGPLRARLIAAVDPALASAPAAPAAEVYSGVLFAHLDLASMPPGARRRAREQVLIASGLWGLLAPGDRIPAYKLPIATPVAGIGRLAAAWRPAVAAALAARDVDGELIVDCRSGGYAAVWRPHRATRVEVRAFSVRPDGARQVISHMAKASRGLVAGALLRSRRTLRSPRDVAAVARGAGFEVELAQPAKAGAPWSLDVLERV
ncbi:MAG: hypothetical protein JWQ48_2623 [Conexibacter sp.]|nr:hypothetical protein [Conexibacter sp.]